MNPISPSKMPLSPKKWLHPNEIMNIQRMKKKKRALQARMHCTQILAQVEDIENKVNTGSRSLLTKRHNPFVKHENVTKSKKTTTTSSPATNLDISLDHTIFEIFGNNETDNSINDSTPPVTSFTNVLSRLNTSQSSQSPRRIGEKTIPVDWALKTKARIMCEKPFQWSKKKRTVEEASSITSFARCFTEDKSSPNINSNPNTRLGQYSMYWQHPNLPWISLFPRHNKKSIESVVTIPNSTEIRQSLHMEWVDSIRSLFQLVRARQCPYFYVCVNSFTVLFRAAGIGGFDDLHAFLTPSSKGFRQILRQEKIEFQMPLLQKKRLSGGTSTTDTGYDSQSLDSSQTSKLRESLEMSSHDIDEDSQHAEWLQSLGFKEEHIKKIQSTQKKIDQRSEHEIDNSEQSLVLIDGTEVNGFFNLLINCKSIIASTGPFAGIPPTLIAPVAFNNGTLKSLKTEESVVHMNESKYYSTEFCGPILPNFMQNMCNLLPSSHNYTITVADLNSTLPFSKTHTVLLKCANENGDNGTTSEIFSLENLSDCGLNADFLKNCCSLNPVFTKHFDSLKYDKNSETFCVY